MVVVLIAVVVGCITAIAINVAVFIIFVITFIVETKLLYNKSQVTQC